MTLKSEATNCIKINVMETIKKNIVLLLLLFGMIGITSQKATSQVSVSFQMFYDNLSVHGNWISDSNYGYVWSPNVGVGFSPYRTNGHWVYTDYGWTWVSNYSWGWAPFHYGRWYYDSYYGWLWVPDTVWAPAWVTWRYYDGYYGWAAIGPSISIDIAFGNSYNIPYNQWVFVRERDFGRPNISSYYIDKSKNTTIIKNSVVVNSIQTNKGNRYNAGPARGHVQKRASHTITQVTLKDRDKPGQKMSGNELQLYKPRVQRSNGSRKEFPAKVMERKNVKPVAERKVEPKTNREEKQLTKQQEHRMEPVKKQRNEMDQRAQQREQQIQQREQQIRNQPREIQREEKNRGQQIPHRSEKSGRNHMQSEERMNDFNNAQRGQLQRFEQQNNRSDMIERSNNQLQHPLRQNTERVPLLQRN